jgi:hypothetical protein
MNGKKLVVGAVACSFVAPFLTSALAHPDRAPPEAPNKVVLFALQNWAVSASTGSDLGAVFALDTMLGREINILAPIDRQPRPAFIGPWVAVQSSSG